MDRKTSNRYRKIFNNEQEHLLNFAIKLAEEGALLPARTRRRTSVGVISALYSKHIEQIKPDFVSIAAEFGNTPGNLKKIARKLESDASHYLNSIDGKIRKFMTLFSLAMRSIEILTDKSVVSIKEFLDLVNTICKKLGSGLESETELFFSRYFYLTGFKAESGRAASSGIELNVTAAVKSTCVILRITRGEKDEPKTND